MVGGVRCARHSFAVSLSWRAWPSFASSGRRLPRPCAGRADASIFYGRHPAGDGGAIPPEVRATVSDITCWPQRTDRSRGRTRLLHHSPWPFGPRDRLRHGGRPVTFLLSPAKWTLAKPAAQTAGVARPAAALDLFARPGCPCRGVRRQLPAGPGRGTMRWTGSSATPIEDAIATIPRDVASVTYLDVPTQRLPPLHPRGTV